MQGHGIRGADILSLLKSEAPDFLPSNRGALEPTLTTVLLSYRLWCDFLNLNRFDIQKDLPISKALGVELFSRSKGDAREFA